MVNIFWRVLKYKFRFLVNILKRTEAIWFHLLLAPVPTQRMAIFANYHGITRGDKHTRTRENTIARCPIKHLGTATVNQRAKLYQNRTSRECIFRACENTPYALWRTSWKVTRSQRSQKGHVHGVVQKSVKVTSLWMQIMLAWCYENAYNHYVPCSWNSKD